MRFRDNVKENHFYFRLQIRIPIMNNVNRRDFLKLTGTSIIGLTLGGVALRANAQEQVKLDDPTALALKYVHDSKVEGQNCENCQHIQGEEGKEWRPCAFFPGKVVASKGWCAGWMKKVG
ncbi:MAG: hypothetical protein ACI8XG_001371 [Congregibacter sp.]